MISSNVVRRFLLLLLLAICTSVCLASPDSSKDDLSSALTRVLFPKNGSRILITTDGRGINYVQESWFAAGKWRARVLFNSPNDNTSELFYVEQVKGDLTLWLWDEEWLVFSQKDLTTVAKELPNFQHLFRTQLISQTLPDLESFVKIETAVVCGGSEKWASKSYETGTTTSVYITRHKTEGFPFICQIERTGKNIPGQKSVTSINENTFVVVIAPNAKRGGSKKLFDLMMRGLIDILTPAIHR